MKTEEEGSLTIFSALSLLLILSFLLENQINDLALVVDAMKFENRNERLMRYCGLSAIVILH